MSGHGAGIANRVTGIRIEVENSRETERIGQGGAGTRHPWQTTPGEIRVAHVLRIRTRSSAGLLFAGLATLRGGEASVAPLES